MSSDETGVSAARNPKSPIATNLARPVLPLVLFALIALTLGLMAMATVGFHLQIPRDARYERAAGGRGRWPVGARSPPLRPLNVVQDT
jgi:hypothetical protein